MRVPAALEAVLNPVQYLGSKARIVPAILRVQHEKGRPGLALDLFSGSSTVSQALAQRAPVVGVDASPAAAALFEGTVRARGAARWSGRVALEPSDLERREQAILARGSVDELVALYREAHAAFERAPPAWTQERWVEAYYGGHYFGFRQARELDELRLALREDPHPPAKAALLGTASRLVASAGKHFATPLNFLGDSITPFVKRRLWDDRRRDARATFAALQEELRSLPPLAHGAASRFVAEALPFDLAALGQVGFVYADPPYTTDQYSRFYHVLDSLARDAPFRVSATKGRYPESRLASAFSHPARAAAAFDALYARVAELGAPFVFSYSAPRAEGSRGRTVTLEALDGLLRRHFARVGVFEEIEHRYRPLQPAERMRPSAAEVLVVAEP